MTNQEGLAFEQGVQIFFIQKILAEGYGRADLVGDWGVGDRFFTEWSRIVSENDGKPGFKRTVTLPENYHQRLEQAEADRGKEGSLEEVSQFMHKRMSLEKPKNVHEAYHDFIKEPRFKELAATLLADEDLGDLMQIEYSEKIAEFAKGQDADLLKTDDETIIKNAIAEHLGKDLQDLTKKDYEAVTGLSLYGKKIDDITLLKQCNSLTKLHLSETGISDISAIKGLTKLRDLWLNNNQISDISAIKGLTNLTRLYLSSNQISDISSLKGLTKLILLDLNNTEVNDLTPIRGLDKLTHLGVSTTQLDNIQAVSELTNLSFLGITKTNVSDLTPIKQLNQLDALFFSGTLVDTLEPLKDLKKLRVLSFQDTKVNNLEPLKELSNLEVLKIRNTQINSLEPIKGLSKLKELLIEGCENITTEQVDELQKALPDCKIQAAAVKETLIISNKWRLFFNPRVPGLSKTKIMRFGKNGIILEGQNNNESSWRIRSGYFEMLDSEGQVHSRFYYNSDKNRFDHTNDPDTGSIRKHSIRDQYILPEK